MISRHRCRHYSLTSRLGRIVAVYRAEPHEPANLARYLVHRTKVWQILLVSSARKYRDEPTNHPKLYLYLDRRTKSYVSVLTLFDMLCPSFLMILCVVTVVTLFVYNPAPRGIFRTQFAARNINLFLIFPISSMPMRVHFQS